MTKLCNIVGNIAIDANYNKYFSEIHTFQLVNYCLNSLFLCLVFAMLIAGILCLCT